MSASIYLRGGKRTIGNASPISKEKEKRKCCRIGPLTDHGELHFLDDGGGKVSREKQK